MLAALKFDKNTKSKDQHSMAYNRKSMKSVWQTYDHDLLGIGFLSGMHRFKLSLRDGHGLSRSSESFGMDSLDTCRAFVLCDKAESVVVLALGGDGCRRTGGGKILLDGCGGGGAYMAHGGGYGAYIG